MSWYPTGQFYLTFQKKNVTSGVTYTFSSPNVMLNMYNQFATIDVRAYVEDLDALWQQVIDAFQIVLTIDGKHPITADFDANNHRIINVSDPQNPQDAVNYRSAQGYAQGNFVSYQTDQRSSITQALQLVAQRNIGVNNIPSTFTTDPTGTNISYALGTEGVSKTFTIQPAYTQSLVVYANSSNLPTLAVIDSKVGTITSSIELDLNTPLGIITQTANAELPIRKGIPRAVGDTQFNNGEFVQYVQDSGTGVVTLPAADGSKLTNLKQGGNSIFRIDVTTNPVNMAQFAKDSSTYNPTAYHLSDASSAGTPITLSQSIRVIPAANKLTTSLGIKTTGLSGDFGYPMTTITGGQQSKSPRFFADALSGGSTIQQSCRFWSGVNTVQTLNPTQTGTPTPSGRTGVVFCPSLKRGSTLPYFDVYDSGQTNPFAGNGLADSTLAWKWRRYYTPTNINGAASSASPLDYITSDTDATGLVYYGWANNAVLHDASESELPPVILYSRDLINWSVFNIGTLGSGDFILDMTFFDGAYNVLVEKGGNLYNYSQPLLTSTAAPTITTLIDKTATDLLIYNMLSHNYQYTKLSSSFLGVNGFTTHSTLEVLTTLPNIFMWKPAGQSWFVNNSASFRTALSGSLYAAFNLANTPVIFYLNNSVPTVVYAITESEANNSFVFNSATVSLTNNTITNTTQYSNSVPPPTGNYIAWTAPVPLSHKQSQILNSRIAPVAHYSSNSDDQYSSRPAGYANKWKNSATTNTATSIFTNPAGNVAEKYANRISVATGTVNGSGLDGIYFDGSGMSLTSNKTDILLKITVPTTIPASTNSSLFGINVGGGKYIYFLFSPTGSGAGLYGLTYDGTTLTPTASSLFNATLGKSIYMHIRPQASGANAKIYTGQQVTYTGSDTGNALINSGSAITLPVSTAIPGIPSADLRALNLAPIATATSNGASISGIFPFTTIFGISAFAMFAQSSSVFNGSDSEQKSLAFMQYCDKYVTNNMPAVKLNTGSDGKYIMAASSFMPYNANYTDYSAYEANAIIKYKGGDATAGSAQFPDYASIQKCALTAPSTSAALSQVGSPLYYANGASDYKFFVPIYESQFNGYTNNQQGAMYSSSTLPQVTSTGIRYLSWFGTGDSTFDCNTSTQGPSNYQFGTYTTHVGSYVYYQDIYGLDKYVSSNEGIASYTTPVFVAASGTAQAYWETSVVTSGATNFSFDLAKFVTVGIDSSNLIPMISGATPRSAVIRSEYPSTAAVTTSPPTGDVIRGFSIRL